MRLRLGVSLFVLLCASAHAGPADWKRQVDAVAQPLLAAGWCKSIVVGLVDGKDQQVFCYGSTGGTTPTTPNADTLYEIGSVSKTFTSLALASMAGEGMVALDDPLKKYLPSTVALPVTSPAIRLTDLATHTAGLPRMPPGVPTDSWISPAAGMTSSQLFAKLDHVALLYPTAGTTYTYSNFGAAVLGQALAVRARRSYEQLISERLLHPLGMLDTVVALKPAVIARAAHGAADDMSDLPLWADTAMAPAGWIKSTMNDMLRYLHAQLEPPDNPLGRAIQATHVPRVHAAADLGVALAWHVRPSRHLTFHNGATGGARSLVAFRDDRAAGVVMLATGTTYAVDAAEGQLLDVLDGKDPAPLALPAEAALAPGALDGLVGRYRFDPNLEIVIAQPGARLTAQITGAPPATLFAQAPDRFHLRIQDQSVTFTRDAGGHVTGLVLHVGDDELPASREP